MAWATVATDLQQLGNALSADIIGWGAAVIGIALTASAVLWVLRLFSGADRKITASHPSAKLKCASPRG